MTIVNLTPHVIVLSLKGKRKTYPKSGTIARVDLDYVSDGELDGFPVHVNRVLKSNMPPAIPGVTYIVSALVLMQVKYAGRTDCIAPDSNHALRDYSGNIISVPGWIR